MDVRAEDPGLYVKSAKKGVGASGYYLGRF